MIREIVNLIALPKVNKMENVYNVPVGKMTCGPDQPVRNVQCLTRKVSFVFYCAPRDDGNRNPMYTAVYGKNATHIGVTDSASYLDGLPYVLIDADTKKVIFNEGRPSNGIAFFRGKHKTKELNDGDRNVHVLGPFNIPNNVKRIALHIANDAYAKNRKFQLFPWAVPDAAHSKVHIYELRTDLQEEFTKKNTLGSIPQENTLAAKPGKADEYFGYLNGDVWLSLSHTFTNDDITQLCPPESLSRTVPGRSKEGSPKSKETPQTVKVDWAVVLQSIYGVGEGSRSLDAFSVHVPVLDIKINFPARAFANAINASARTTVQQALRRTSPRAFAALLKASWHLNIDTVFLSSSWRPMLGSKLHKMGAGLDVTEFVDSIENIDFSIRNHGASDHKKPFPTTVGGKKMSQLYEELIKDQQVSAPAVYTPWVNWVEPHDTHMHITVNDD